MQKRVYKKLREFPELTERAAQWFHEKWGIPVEEYRKSMKSAVKSLFRQRFIEHNFIQSVQKFRTERLPQHTLDCRPCFHCDFTVSLQKRLPNVCLTMRKTWCVLI